MVPARPLFEAAMAVTSPPPQVTEAQAETEAELHTGGDAAPPTHTQELVEPVPAPTALFRSHMMVF